MTREGSFTIELSLLMPLIIFVFLLILFLNYYVHDRIAIDKACYIAALRSANYPDEAERENIALTVLNREIPARLLWKWDYTEGVQVMADEVIVSFEGTMLVREGLINRYLSGKLFAYNASQSASVIDEDDYIRSL